MTHGAPVGHGADDASGRRAPTLQEALVLTPGSGEAFAARIEPHLCVGPRERQFMFGGSGMALAIRAIELRLGATPSWLTVQFIAPSPLGDRLDLAVERLGGGQTSHVAVEGRIGRRTVMRGLGAVGLRPGGAPEVQTARAPDAPPPQDCPPIQPHANAEHDAHQFLELRLARGRFGMFSRAPVSEDGQVRVWMRPARDAMTPAVLAMMADFVPSTTSDVLGERAGGSSLDNTLRILRLVPTEWVLCDISVRAIHGGLGHGRMELFAEDGTLMAMASQSYVVRMLPPRRSRSEDAE